MSNADRTYSPFGPLDAEPRSPATVEDLLQQLDRIAEPCAPEFDQDGLDHLMAWMASDDDPNEPDPIDNESGAPGDDGLVHGKFLVAGGERAGTVEFIRQVSDVSGMTDIALPAEASPPVPDEHRRVFFGRLAVADDLHLYHLTTPDSFNPRVWNQLVKGGIGALVLAEARHLPDSHDALNYFDQCGLPYVLVLRGTPEACPYDLAEIREALRLPDDVPILFWDRRITAKAALIALLELALARRRAEAPEGDNNLDDELTALALLTQLELLMQ
ncbi:hypothetical protein [Streptomyces sp. NPDC093591]|uniref:hypothetical protein n=1 Tax=Streptomyces sp. NPDC093591 TaxID=3366044 RepID=UPI003814A292